MCILYIPVKVVVVVARKLLFFVPSKYNIIHPVELHPAMQCRGPLQGISANGIVALHCKRCNQWPVGVNCLVPINPNGIVE